MQQLSIEQKVIELFEYSYTTLKQFPKSERFTLVSEIKLILNNILKYTITGVKKYYKKTTLQDLDIEISKLKIFIRLCKDLGFISFKKYEIWIKKILEIGRMVGGWINSLAKK
jgi:four helix bundle protein